MHAFFIKDAIAESRRRIEASGAASVEEVRAQSAPLIGFSPAASSADESIRSFLSKNMYRHPRLVRIRDQAGLIVRDLFFRLFRGPDLPAEWAEAAAKAGTSEARRARVVCDYIAGMTDRYAVAEHRRYFG